MDLNSRLEKINAVKGVASGLILDGKEFALIGDSVESLKAAFKTIHPKTVFDESRCDRVLVLKELHLVPPTKKKK